MFGPKISAAFVQAQKAFGPALKSSTNPHFRSRYADLAACVEAVIDALNQHGIALMQMTSECEDGVIVETVLLHESGEALPCGKLHVVASKQDPQGYGSALTYARRYSLMAACGIAPEDDDGNAASRKVHVNLDIIKAGIQAITDSINSEELNKAYATAYAAAAGDAAWQAQVINAKKARIERAKQEKTNG